MTIEQEHSNGRTEFHVNGIASWDGFERICRFFSEHLNAEFLSKNDGPDARVWKMKLDNEILVVVHDDMVGNFFFAERQEGNSVAVKIAHELSERIRLANE
ncbi:MAG: hypothetical protein V4719_26380 [Planctomycetota bacterium]